jgi:hypothetical protein
MATDLEPRLEALEHTVSVLVAFSAELVAEARGVGRVQAVADLGERVITWAAGTRSRNPDPFYDALVKLMKQSYVVSQAIEDVQSGLQD